MKILLINPSGGPEEEYGALSKASTELPQLGLAAIATALSSHGHDVRIVDYHIERLNTDRLLGIIKDGRYALVGFSAYVTSVKKTYELAKKIKDQFPYIKVCVGGPQATLQPHDFNKDYVDYIFLGEADDSIVDLVNFLNNGNKGFPDIRGLLYNDAGVLKGNSELNLIADLDRLPIIELDKFYDLSSYYPPIYQRGVKNINLVSGRGCPFMCSFCAAAEINGRRIRQMSVARFLEYIEAYIKKGYDSFMFYDDTFTVSKKRVIEISKEIIRRKLKISWNCWSRVDCIDSELLSYMRDAGCYLVVFGGESMNDKTLTLLHKGFTAEQALKGIETAKQAGLLTVSSFMLGLPGETKEDILHTIRTVNRTRLDFAVWPIFEPYKGTPIYEICRNQGHWIKEKRFKNMLMLDQEEIWEPHSISRAEIEKLARYAFRSFYFRPYFFVSFYKAFRKLPLNRKIRFINSGFDYFIFNKLPFHKKQYAQGSRYR